MYYIIEPMHEDDIPHVQEIERQSFSTPWSANTYRRELRSPETSRYIVARKSPVPPSELTHQQFERRGFFSSLLTGIFPPKRTPSPHPIVGYGGLWLMVDEGHITTIAVDPQERGKGLGELLLNGLIDQAYELSANMLTLEVRISNTVAQNLYLKYGFKPAGTRPRYYNDNNEDALVMWTDEITADPFKSRLTELRSQLGARLRAQARPVR